MNHNVNCNDFQHIMQQVEDFGEDKTIEIGENWLQGRSVFGGLSAAMGMRAARLACPDDRMPLSLLTAFVAPVESDNVSLKAQPLRSGGNVTHLSVQLKHGESVCTNIHAAFGKKRSSVHVPADHPFHGPDWPTLEPAPFLKGFPTFLENFECRWVGDGIPTSGTKDRRCRLWVRHKKSLPEHLTCETLVLLADIPPAVVMSHYKHRLNVSSLTWALDFVAHPGEREGKWLFLDCHLEAAHGGYSQQRVEIFDESKKLVALSHQCMTFFE